MPELKALPPGAVKGFAAAAVDLESIKYSDKVREKARIVRLAAKKEESAKALGYDKQGSDRTKPCSIVDAKNDRNCSSSDGSDGGSGDSDSNSSAVSSQDTSKQSITGVKRLRKGRKKVLVSFHVLRSVVAAVIADFFTLQGNEGAWSIKKAKASAKRKRKVCRC